jgi:hypothetical protein
VHQALASLARGTDLPPSLDVAGMLALCLSKGIGVAECLDVLTAMAKTEEGARNLLAVPGLLDRVLEVQEGCKLDERMSSQCFIALAALAAHPSTSLLVASRPKAVRLAAEWIDDNMDLAGPAVLCRAVTLMCSLAGSPACALQLLSEGFADIIKNVIQKSCVDADVPAPDVLSASIALMQKLGTTPDAIAKLHETGIFKRVTRACAANNAYLKDATCIAAVLDLFSSCASAPEVGEALVTMGAQTIIISAMNLNATSKARTPPPLRRVQQSRTHIVPQFRRF